MKVVTFLNPWHHLMPVEIDDDRDIRKLAATLGIATNYMRVMRLGRQDALRAFMFDMNFDTVQIFQTLPVKRTIMRIEGAQTGLPTKRGCVVFNAWSIESARQMANAFGSIWAEKFRTARGNVAIGEVNVSHWGENTMETCQRTMNRSVGLVVLTEEELNY